MNRAILALAAIGGLSLLSAVIGGLYGMSLIHHGFGTRDAPSEMERQMASAARLQSIPESAKNLANPVKSSPEVLAEARAHWADHCASCHANDGSGETQIGRNLYPRSPDMRAAETQALTDGQLGYIIQNGIRLTGMPAWGTVGDHGDELSSWKLVAFIRHLPSLTAAERMEMERLNPKGPDDRMEEMDEANFLNGDDDQDDGGHAAHLNKEQN